MLSQQHLPQLIELSSSIMHNFLKPQSHCQILLLHVDGYLYKSRHLVFQITCTVSACDMSMHDVQGVQRLRLNLAAKQVCLGRSKLCLCEVTQMLIVPDMHLWQQVSAFKRCCLPGLHTANRLEHRDHAYNMARCCCRSHWNAEVSTKNFWWMYAKAATRGTMAACGCSNLG